MIQQILSKVMIYLFMKIWVRFQYYSTGSTKSSHKEHKTLALNLVYIALTYFKSLYLSKSVQAWPCRLAEAQKMQF